ncbi:unnamed protein product, partial [Callosobruchus maculatus]
DEYINRKRYHSTNVQATCNADEWFASVDASWPASVHDSRIWSNTKFLTLQRESFRDHMLYFEEMTDTALRRG